MARILSARDSVLQQNESYGLFTGAITPMARLDVDGQNGITTDYRTLNAMTPYMKQNTICFVLEVPRGFAWLPNGKKLAIALKSLMETHSETIDGLDASVKVEYGQVAIGSTEQLDAVSKVTRERSEPTHKWTEKYGLAIGRLFQTWITMLLQDPITRIPGIVTLKGLSGEFSEIGKGFTAYTHLPENTSMTCLYVEPDPTCSYPVKAWLCTNMMPDNCGDYTGSMDKQGSSEVQEITVKFTCVQEVGPGVMNLAEQALHSVTKTGLSSMNRRAYIGDSYEDAIASAVGNAQVGFMNQAKEISNSESIDAMNGTLNQVDGVPNGNQDGTVLRGASSAPGVANAQ